MKIITGKRKRPRRILLYGTHGIGKSSWAAKSPSPLFLQTESGLDDIGADRTPLLTQFSDVPRGGERDQSVEYWLNCLMHEEHEYKTVVIDTLDWCERLIWQEVANDNGVEVVGDIGYGKGYQLTLTHWNRLLDTLDTLLEKRGIGIILLAHSKDVRVEPPDGDTYTRYEPDLYKNVAPLLQEWCDEVLFANYEVNQIAKDEGFNRTRHIAIGGERVVYTREMPAHLAKRRIDMPDKIALEWNTYAGYVKAAYAGAEPGNINGIVKDGSSKPQKKESE